MKKTLALILSLIMVVSCFSGIITGVQATGISPIAGDINGDENVNNKDLTRLMKYLAGEDVEVVTVAIDPNGDGNVNNKDLTRLMRYLSGDDVVIGLSGCTHEKEAVVAVEATCTNEGNIAYWYCADCNKYFSDSEGVSEITFEDTVIEKLPHTEEVVPGYPATTEDEGLTDGIRCTICETVIKEQEIIPISEYAIVYNVYGNDTYLKNLYLNGKIENANPVSYSSEVGVAKFKNLKVPGYVFEGWYDAPGSSGEIVKSIPAGTTGEFEVYAKWTLVEYEVIFDSPDVPVENQTFTVNKSVPLRNIELQGYTFIGWSIKEIILNPVDGTVFSDNGKIITEIPVGTAEDVVVHANWTSNRNFVKPVSKLDDPLFVEDMDNEQLIFVYKIGTIENVPIGKVADLPNSAGLTWAIESDVTTSIDTTTAQTIANTVSNATTTTAGWTLSEDWNDVITTTDESGSENAKTQGQIDETGTVTGQQWYVSNSEGGAFTSSSSSGGSSSTNAKITDNASWGLESAKKTEVSNSKTDTHQTELNTSLTAEQKETFDWKLGGSVGGGNEVSAGVNGSIGEKDVASVGASAGAKKSSNWSVNGEVGGSTEKSLSATIAGGVVDTHSSTVAAARSQGVTATINGSHGTELSSVSENHYETSQTASSNWNTTSSYEMSENVSVNKTTSEAISEVIYNKTGISSSASIGGSDVKTESTGRTSGTEDQYSSTVEYSTSEIKALKQTLTNEGSGYGYYRVVQAATAHVFAVVGFDIATQSFYVTTHTIVDNESAKIFIDHSRKSSSFDDCENGLLEFEVPFDLYKFVTRVMMRSEGLKINYETGEVERYEGTGANVVIPEYAVDFNSNTGKYSVTRVTSISPSAFRNNENITGIIIPDYITEIPDGAFEGCTNLESFVSYGVTKVGANAFKDCVSLKHYSIDRFVTELGEKAFENVNSIDVVAANAAVVDAALASGAKNISIDASYVDDSLDNKVITVGAIKSFRFLGKEGKEYNNLKFVSDAETTTLGDLILKNNGDTPIKLASKIVNLNSVSVIDAPGFAMILTGEAVDVIVDGTNNFSSQSGNTVLCKNISVVEQNVGSVGKINVTGNVLAYAEKIDGKQFINVSSGGIVYISENEYNNYLTLVTVVFDAGEGTIFNSETSKKVSYGQKYGYLPVPTRDNYGFIGWFTEKDGGTEITAETVVQALVNQTLYAHWTPNKFTLVYDANGGTVSTLSKELTFGESYGTLPIPTRDYYTFLGWYTDASGETQVSENTTPTSDDDITIYAHWEQKPVSGWVKESELPSGAQLVDEKWTYNLTTTTTSSSSTLDGWTLYDTQRTSWGSKVGPVYSDPSNGLRNVWSEKYVSSTTTHYKYYHRYNGGGLWSTDALAGSWARHTIDLTYALGNGYYASDYNIQFKGSYKCPTCGATNMWLPDGTYTENHYSTRWYYQEPVYTYYFTKTESLESSTEVTASDSISDVQRWVQYREK